MAEREGFWHRRPGCLDLAGLWLLAALVTLQPYFLRGAIKVFEMGIYLPAIDAFLRGEVPYRDFFYLRGPLEIAVPAGLMRLFGPQFAWLSFYFYAGTILTLWLSILIAKELYRTRVVLFSMSLVLVARTFPRIFYKDWGGLRYAWGLLAVWSMIRFFSRRRSAAAFTAGAATACGLLTSVEIGVYAIAGWGAALLVGVGGRILSWREVGRAAGLYLGGLTAVAVPILASLAIHGALGAYVDSLVTIVTHLTRTFDQHAFADSPRNLFESLSGMVHPTSKNFRHLTPAYLYIFWAADMVRRLGGGRLRREDLALVCLGGYGCLIYQTAFRSIWGPQFEMALQPEKILLFYYAQEAYDALRRRSVLLRERLRRAPPRAPDRRRLRAGLLGVGALLFGFVASSVGYSLDRYNKRFFAVRYLREVLTGGSPEALRPLAEGEGRPLHHPRGRGLFLPNDQAEDIEGVTAAVRRWSRPGETVLMFPDLGAYSFFVDRPFPGRFPMPVFSWFKEAWYREFLLDLDRHPPRLVVRSRDLSSVARTSYLGSAENRRRYEEMEAWIRSRYRLRATTPSCEIYERRDDEGRDHG